MEILNLVKANKVISSFADEKININLSYKFMKFLKLTNDSVEFYNSKIKEIINKYARKNDKDENIIINGDIMLDSTKKNEIEKDLNELNQIEINDINVKFTLKELQGLTISVNDLVVLDEFIKEEE